MNNYTEIKHQWDKDIADCKASLNDWKNDWVKLGWNALIPLVILGAFFIFIGRIIVTGH